MGEKFLEKEEKKSRVFLVNEMFACSFRFLSYAIFFEKRSKLEKNVWLFGEFCVPLWRISTCNIIGYGKGSHYSSSSDRLL